MKRIMKFINDFLKKLTTDHIGEYTAQCAYFIFLSFIPFIILLLSLIKYMNIDKDTLAYILEALLPQVMKNSVLDIIQEVYSKSIETVSISLVFMLWSAAKSFYGLTLGLSTIYKGREEENYVLLRVKGIIGTIIALFSIVMALVFIVFGNNLEAIVKEHFKGAIEITSLILSIRGIVLLVSLFIVFILMYRFVPSKNETNLKNQIPGAIFAAVRVVYSFVLFLNICKYIY